MKKIDFFVFSAIIGLVAFSCKSDNSSIKDEARASLEKTEEVASNLVETTGDIFSGPTTTIEFEESTYNFGSVESGEKVTKDYVFVNTGKEPLLIQDAKASCGCTVPNWPKEPIAPGDKGVITAEFNTAGKSGNQTKTVTVTANTNPSSITLTLSGEVTKTEAPAS